MAEAVSTSQPPPRRRLSRWVAAPLMALMGAVAAAMVIALDTGGIRWRDDLEQLMLFGLSGAFGAGLSAWLVMGWAIARTEFGWGVALVVGAVTALLSYPMFGLALSLVFMFDVEVWHRGFIEPLAEAAGLVAAASIVGPVFSGHVTLPMGAVGGLICRALSKPEETPHEWDVAAST
ncbi:MAG: hypothetical protein KTR21_12830 [Rhodobacteraceae bacterium]|nr:hypothetical protein [Paracoccaceae bacterium]